MQTSDRNSIFPESRDDEISVLSWNLLAPSYDNFGYDWQGVRLPELRRWLARFVACDVLCFQEVDLGNSLTEISEFLSAHGFAVVVQERKDFPVVTTTCFKTSRLHLRWSQHRSRALVVGLALAGGRELCVANVHLEAGGSEQNEKQRNAQLASVLKRVKGNAVICGDFNSDLAHGSLLHSQMVDSALTQVPTKGITLAHSGYADILDHIWASENLKACRVLGSSSEELAAITAAGMPNETHPSDHLPVAATFGFTCSLKHEPDACTLPAVDVPIMPSEEVRKEWLQLCSCAEVGRCKRAARAQKKLEAAFLQMFSNEEAKNLRKWRADAHRAAKHVLSEAVERAIASFEVGPAIGMKPFATGAAADFERTPDELRRIGGA